jgi:hypothetical protein
VAISFHLHSELDVLTDSVQVVKEFSQLVGSMLPDDECVINVVKPTEGRMGRHLQNHFFKVLHEIGLGKAANPYLSLAHFLTYCYPFAIGQPVQLDSYITSYLFAQGSLIALMMEAVCTSEMSVNVYLTTQQYIPED